MSSPSWLNIGHREGGTAGGSSTRCAPFSPHKLMIRPPQPSSEITGGENMSVYRGLAILLIGIGAPHVQAQSLKDKQYFAEQEAALAKEAAFTAKKCATAVTATFDWSTPPKAEDRKVYSASGYCGPVLEAMRRVCEGSQAGKDAVKEKIKTVTCGFGGERTVALKDGAVRYSIDFKSSNDADYVFEYLQNNL
jgi:hypothetical protein